MKRLLTALSAVAAASLALGASAYAKTAAPATPAQQMQSVLGTWKCTSPDGSHTSTFASILNGKAMRISENAMGGSEDLVTFDAKRKKWIDQHVDAQSYGVMEGMPVKGGIDFAMVYPAGMNATFSVRFPAKNKQVTTYTGTMNGKTITQHETCTKM